MSPRKATTKGREQGKRGQLPQDLNQIDLHQCCLPFMSTFWEATIREMASLREVAHDYAKREQRPRPNQLVGTIGLVHGCDSDRDCLRMAIHLVTRVRGIKRRSAGETLAMIARSYNVDVSMISRVRE